MKKIEQFQIIGMTISGFKSYEGPTELTFGNPKSLINDRHFIRKYLSLRLRYKNVGFGLDKISSKSFPV